MDVTSLIKKIATLNNHIKNSLVKKGSQTTPIVEKIVDYINTGKMVYDSILGQEKPDPKWNQATLLLQRCKDSLTPDIFNLIIADIKKLTKPHKLQQFNTELEKWLQKDSVKPEIQEEIAISANKIQNLLKVATYIEKSADNMIAAKVRLARLIDSHIGHIVGLIERNQPEKAKEYLEVIRPHGWEQNAERNVDKLYEQVVKGLSEKLDPAAFQSLGL